MKGSSRLKSPLEYSETLFGCMASINPGVRKLALYEFRYALENMIPPEGWDSVPLDEPGEIEKRIRQREYYEAIQLKPRVNDRIVLDPTIKRLTQMLMIGLATNKYSEEWVNKYFYFDIRGFYFLPRTVYFTKDGLDHFGGKPYYAFTPRQKQFDEVQDVGYLDFQAANAEVDQAFIRLAADLIEIKGTPILVTLAGPTAAGKTEITERLLDHFTAKGKKTTTIEMDNFLMDRDFREGKSIDKKTIHFNLFQKSLTDILQGKAITIPCYDSIDKVSSHDPEGNLRPGGRLITIEPGDVIFLEGNFPFQIPEIRSMIHLMVIYLTDDPIRLKRKWKRDVDYRKSYDPSHFRNRFFVTQFLRAEDCFRGLIAQSDIVVDTTGAAIWLTPEIAQLLDGKKA
jgi:uridine kinase